MDPKTTEQTSAVMVLRSYRQFDPLAVVARTKGRWSATIRGDMILTLLLALQPANLEDAVDQIYADCRAADLKALKELVADMRRQHRTVFPDYFALALPLVRKEPARDWVASTLFKEKTSKRHDRTIQLACINAIGEWRHAKGLARVRKRFQGMIKKKAPNRDWLVACAKALADADTYSRLARHSQFDEPYMRLAAAYCLPAADVKSADGIWASPHAGVVAPAIARAGPAHKKRLEKLVRDSPWLRVRESAAQALTRLGLEAPKVEMTGVRVTLVLDVSSQMDYPNYYPNRIAVAKHELKRKLHSLPDTVMFQLIAFAGHVSVWKREAVPATAENKKAAESWLRGHARPRGNANTHSMLTDERYLIGDAYVYSSSVPNVGIYERYADLLVRLRQSNRFRAVRIHTIAVNFPRGGQTKRFARFMKDIADITGGTFREIRKPPPNVKR